MPGVVAGDVALDPHQVAEGVALARNSVDCRLDPARVEGFPRSTDRLTEIEGRGDRFDAEAEVLPVSRLVVAAGVAEPQQAVLQQVGVLLHRDLVSLLRVVEGDDGGGDVSQQDQFLCPLGQREAGEVEGSASCSRRCGWIGE